MFASNFQPPENWDRSGLPGWTYASEEMFTLELDVLFRRHWMLACHISDLPEPGHYVGFDIGTERALILRGKDGVIRAFHNLCRHRGSRVVEDAAGQCKQALTCPFHGWTYNLDGTLKSALQPRSFPPLDPVEWGLKPIEMDIWHGFVFIRFQPGPQPPMSTLLARFDNLVTPHGMADMMRVEGEFVFAEADVNWKSMRDVDNEGYHVPKAHPSLQDLYGKDYVDEPYIDGASLSIGKLNDTPRQFWSVREYRKLVSRMTHLPAPQNDCWIYIGVFPNSVIALYPDSAVFYQEIPTGVKQTRQRGAVYRFADESREMRAARYLSGRIDGLTADEDLQLTKWTDEAPESSGFDGIILSDLEYGVRSHHDQLRALMPVFNDTVAPPAGTLAARNRMLAESMAQETGRTHG